MMPGAMCRKAQKTAVQTAILIFGYVFSVKGNVNGRTAVWRLGINVKRKMVWHFGHGF